MIRVGDRSLRPWCPSMVPALRHEGRLQESTEHAREEHNGNQAYSNGGRGERPGDVAGLRFGPLSLSSCGRLHAGGGRHAREATAVCARVESTRGEPGSGDSTVVVAPTTHHRMNEAGRGADGTQPHRSFVQNNSDTMSKNGETE